MMFASTLQELAGGPLRHPDVATFFWRLAIVFQLLSAGLSLLSAADDWPTCFGCPLQG